MEFRVWRFAFDVWDSVLSKNYNSCGIANCYPPRRTSASLQLPTADVPVPGSKFWSLSLSKCKVQSLVKSNLEVDCLLPLPTAAVPSSGH
jgi:hypothetical protein